MQKHGESRAIRSPEYILWVRIRQSCYNPKRPEFHRYGGRGITVCARWRRSFKLFLRDVGRRPTPAHSLDRRDNNKGYAPGNCRWATKKEQNRNRSSNRIVNGKTVTEIAEMNGFLPSTLIARLNRGMTIEAALAKRLRVTKTWELQIGRSKIRAATAARRSGIAAMTVYSRLKNGWTGADAVGVAPGSRGTGRKVSITVTVAGETRSLIEWARLAGVKVNTMRERLRRHPEWPIDRVISDKFRPGPEAAVEAALVS